MEERKEKDVIIETPAVEEPVLETPPDVLTQVLEAINGLKGDIANLTQKVETQNPPIEEEPIKEVVEEEPKEEISEEEQEDISDMFKD